jgi:gliding motility-associated lipoprotein GldD
MMSKERFFSLFILLSMVLICVMSACTEPVPVPKPRSYPRIDFPEKQYVAYEPENCPFRFVIPAYAQAERDTQFFDTRPPNDCWINVFYPQFNGQLYCSYYPVRNMKELDQLITDGYKMTSKHMVRADFIDETLINKEGNVHGVLFDVSGAAASGVQFFLTDSSRHFFSASLYFNTSVRPDSLKPVIDFIHMDILKMIESFEWR